MVRLLKQRKQSLQLTEDSKDIEIFAGSVRPGEHTEELVVLNAYGKQP